MSYLIFSAQRYFVTNCAAIWTTTTQTRMWSNDTNFIIHQDGDKCQVDREEEEDQDGEKEASYNETILQSLSEWKWGSKAQRLYKFIVDSNVTPISKDDVEYEGMFLVDILKYCTTMEFSDTKSKKNPLNRKLEKSLRSMKQKGLRIPHAYLTRPSIRKLFS